MTPEILMQYIDTIGYGIFLLALFTYAGIGAYALVKFINRKL